MSQEHKSLNPEMRLIISAGIVVLVLVLASAIALLVLRPSPPFRPPTPASLPSPTLPPTFTPRPTATQPPTLTPTPTATVTPSPTPIVVAWRRLGYLTAVEYTAKTVTEIKGEPTFWGTDWVLVEVAGRVQFGVDMNQIRDEDVTVNGQAVNVILPRPKVTSVELLLDETYVYRAGKKLLFSEIEQVTVRALEQAQEDLRTWSGEQESLIELAQEMAQRRLEAFLRQLGFEQITITFRPEGEG